jgi:hypothetical protein
MKRALFCLAVLLALTSAADASSYYAWGEYTFICNVRNESYKEIYSPRISGYVNGSSAQLQVQAQGYQQAYQTVFIRPNVKQYNVDVTLRDNTVYFDTLDDEGKRIAGVYVNNWQGSYWADEYGAVFTVPKEGFSNLTQRDIEVKVNYFTAFAKRIWLSNSGNSWRIEVVVQRRDVDSFSNRLYVILKRDAVPAPPAQPKPSTLAAKIEFVKNAMQSAKLSASELVSGQIALLEDEIEAEIMKMADPQAGLEKIVEISPELASFAETLSKKAAARAKMTEN